MGIKYSSYKRKEIVKKKNIKEFYNLIENSNHGIVMMNEKNQICLYNPEIRRLCGLSPKEITSNVGNSPVKNNKPGGQGLLNLYQPQYKISAFMLIKAIIEEVNKNYTAKTIFLLQNKKNPENIFFGQSYLRRIQIEKQTLTLVSFFPIKDTPFIDPYHSENEATIKKIKPKMTKESKKKNKNNTKEKNKKVKERTIQKKTKKNSRHSGCLMELGNFVNFDSQKNFQPSVVELDSDSDTDHNNNPLTDYENSNYTDNEEEISYGSWVQPLTDFEKEPQKNSLNQKQNFNQTNNIQNNIQNQDQMVFLTNDFVMSKLIELNNSNSNSSSRKKTKVVPNEPNSNPNGFKGGSFNNIKKNRKNKISNKKNNNNREKFKAKFDTQQKYKTFNNFKNRKTKKNKKNKTKSNQKNIKINNIIVNTNININNITNKTNNYKINNINNTTNKNITNSITNNNNTVKNTRNNDSLHINPNNNKNITNYNKIDNNNNNKIHANTNINKNNLNENAIFNDKNEIENTKGTINNNIFKNSTTVGNTIYKFVINEDQKFETDLQNILPCSKEIDNIFQDYESESKSSDSQLD
ncbi:hypothetical protein M0812_28511 [Anaeramoeba flamelloides]|uniref:PAS domain-containing protein n=1 Tax=Anaeramoeba flamelloides TaxID=1746091 RepID=A0AAV7YET2_9EUKA|nr:hypothetical protein M0812_28511 [Anaeramoeba flamelloides]